MTMKMQSAAAIHDVLSKIYPPVRSFLDFETPWQLLLATILSAQCTDERVNMVTPAVFARWAGPEEMAQASQADVEALVRSTGFV